MKLPAAALLLLVAFTILPCPAQVLSTSEHRDLMKRLGTAAFDWQRRVESLNIDNLNVSYSIGKTMTQEKEVVLKNLAFIQKAADQQLVRDWLSTDISVETSLMDVMNFSADIVNFLPDSAEAARWGRAAPKPEEFKPYMVSLQKHILSYADQLQEQASKCSR